ncbi:MAG: signal peptide peptidase SppA [Rhodospirillales bacterium]|nr:signal peptide peptidase SppA [Rhodospirillales bacterium]MDH3917106.1 signal peptide peptidase SppA [Rhodospirillales bacterium]MDH3966871.1 signal peptide peptidase SppA [Rhodospirillales bacterium]
MRAVMFILKSLVGLFAAIGFLVLVALIGLALLVSRAEPLKVARPEMPESAVLTLDLAQGVVEVRPDNPLARASLGEVIALREALEALEAAGRDPRIKGLVARVGRGDLDIALVQELRDAIGRFRAQGRFAVAFAESLGEGGNGTQHYYLASAFERIWLQPSGDLDLTGVLIQSPFLRTALDKLGVEPQLAQREEFKGVMNTLTDTALPAPQRRNLQRLVDSWVGQIAAGIAEGRQIDAGKARALIDGGPYDAEGALEAGLADRLGYWDEVRAAVLAEAGDEAELFALSDYARARDEPERDGPVVGLIYGLGPVQLGESENDPGFGQAVMGADTVAQAISDALDDPEVEAIVFRVDSPGGSYVASDVIWREMQRAREAGTPVVVSMGGVAASGGYFVAIPAHRIVAQPGTVTGSIGVVAGKLVLSGLWDKLGVAWDGVQAGDNADIWSMNRSFSEDGWARLERRLDGTYDDFTAKVAAGRGLALEDVLKVAKGQVWTGEDAAKNGLVDELGGLELAIALAAEAVEAEPGTVQLRRFPEERDPVRAFLEDMLGSALESPGLGALARELARLAQALAPLLETTERLREDPRTRTLMAPDLRPARR